MATNEEADIRDLTALAETALCKFLEGLGNGDLYRDVVAVVAMTIVARLSVDTDERVDFAFIAKIAYGLADAMLAEKEKRA